MIRTEDVKKFIVDNRATIREALKVINRNKEGIALVVDKGFKLLGTITDGDVRRFILKDGDMNLRCDKVMNTSYICAKSDSEENIRALMAENRIRHIPLLKDNKRLDKLFVSDTIYDPPKAVTAVIMAGGEGRRLKKIARNIPKPLLKIKDKPILEELIINLRRHDIKEIYLALNYKAEAFKNYFKDGSEWGVDIKYLVEKKRLGTAGALSLLPEEALSDAILVVNADVLTSVDFKSFIRFHQEHRFLMCIAAKEYVFDIPFGVFEMSKGCLTGVREKPSKGFFCNAGIYVMNREALRYIPRNKSFDMTDLMKVLIKRSLAVGIFPVYEYWIDIGDTKNYRTAEKEYEEMFKKRAYE